CSRDSRVGLAKPNHSRVTSCVREPPLAPNTILCCNYTENSLGIQGPMARKCSTPGCAFSLPDKYPLSKCPWHLAPGRGHVKIAAAIAIAAAGCGGAIVYKKFRAYLRDKDKKRDARRKKPVSKQEPQQASAGSKPTAPKSQKQPRARKKTATKSKRTPAKA